MDRPAKRKLFESIAARVADAPGMLSASVRHAALYGNEALPPVLAALREKILTRAVELEEADFRGFYAQGYTEDQAFEFVVATALGASRSRLQRSLALLQAVNASPERDPTGSAQTKSSG